MKIVAKPRTDPRVTMCGAAKMSKHYNVAPQIVQPENREPVKVT